jgi:enoyl-CoA hydratase
MTVALQCRERAAIAAIARPGRKNAVGLATARALFDAFCKFNADDTLDPAVLAGADLKVIAEGSSGLRSLESGEIFTGAAAFAEGEGRHGSFHSE